MTVFATYDNQCIDCDALDSYCAAVTSLTVKVGNLDFCNQENVSLKLRIKDFEKTAKSKIEFSGDIDFDELKQDAFISDFIVNKRVILSSITLIFDNYDRARRRECFKYCEGKIMEGDDAWRSVCEDAFFGYSGLFSMFYKEFNLAQDDPFFGIYENYNLHSCLSNFVSYEKSNCLNSCNTNNCKAELPIFMKIPTDNTAALDLAYQDFINCMAQEYV